MNPWILFALSATAIVLAGRKLSDYGDQLATHTGLGRAFVGSILLAGATSLPEVVASGTAAYQGWGNLAMGNVFGSNIFNMTLLVLGQMVATKPILQNVSSSHITVAAKGMLLSGIAALAMLIQFPVTFLGAGLDIWVILIAYVILVMAMPKGADPLATEAQAEQAVDAPPPVSGLLLWSKFGAAAAVVVVAGWFLSSASEQIATMTGLGETFVGSTLLAAATSLPELVVTIFTIRNGAYDLALGNVLGSNTFNMLILVIADFALPGKVPLLSMASMGQVLAALLGLVLSGIVVVALSLPKGPAGRRIPWEMVAIAATYLVGVWFLYTLR